MEIYVYGTGCGAGELIDTALDARRVTAFVDPAAKGSFLGRPVIAPQELAGRPLDLLIVAGRQAEAIARELAELGIDENRVLYLKNHLIPAERNRNYALAERVLGKAYVERLRNSERLIRAPLWTQQERIAGPEADNDYVRLKTLEALCLRLDGIPGAVAELGVYRGGFSHWLNLLLPERTLLLFDTFEGFDPTEAQGQSDGFVEAHRNSSVERVLAALPHPEKAAVRQGLFPQTAQGLENERFALVSLDADLEESTYAGLCFFLPRMSEGGYLLLHDYNHPRLPGVRRAVERWEAEHGRLAAVPLCDVNGTLVISV